MDMNFRQRAEERKEGRIMVQILNWEQKDGWTVTQQRFMWGPMVGVVDRRTTCLPQDV